MTVVPPLVRARMIERAATLDERIAASTPDGADPSQTALIALRPWIQAYSAGNQEAFLCRLGWDGLDLPKALAAVGGPLRFDSSPAWLTWVDRFVIAATRADPIVFGRHSPDGDANHSGERGACAAGGAPPPAMAELPFGELWLPVCRAARAELHRQAGNDLDTLSPAALIDLERRLLQDAATVAEQAVLERFQAGLGSPASSASERQAYDAFVARMLEGGDLVAFFTEYPVVARLLAALAETWVSAGAEFAGRLAADHAELEKRYAGGEHLGRVESIEPGSGDRHHGGRRVMALRFESGVRVVYKPRSVGLERAFSTFVDWARGEGADLPPGLDVLERDGYGWVEFASSGGFADLSQVRRYFRRAGGLLCVAHVLRGRDLHMENVIATLEGPQLVDTEMLLQPETASAPATPEGEIAAGPSAQDTCLGSGLLSLLQTDGEGGQFDVGGLRGTGTGRAPLARRVWRALGTDAIHFVREPRFEPGTGNRVLLAGEPQRPDDFAAEIVAGFEQAYRVLLARREALLAEAGPLAAFAGKEVRVLLRTSTQYGALQYVLTSPQYQRSGLRRSFAMDSLNRCFARERQRPQPWPLVADERRALDQLDIPRFTVDSSATTVCSGSGEPVGGWFARSGFDSVNARVGALGEDDLALQAECLAGALACSVESRFETPAPTAEPANGEAEELATLRAHARWIGRELLRHAETTAAGPRWPTPPYAGARSGFGPLRLYDGASGPALLLAALFATTGEPEWRDEARAAFATVAADAAAAGPALHEDESIGAASGIGSVVYALGLGSRLLEEPELLQPALGAARLLTARRITADRRLDVAGGAAGAALALVALHELCSESWLLDRAVDCALHLEAASVATDGGGAAWPAADGRLLAGMAHGAAGIAYALARVAERSGEQRLLGTARAGCSYERSLYSAAERNWPVVGGGARNGGASTMAAWCHGAPGIGLARALSLTALDEPWLRADIEAALQTTADAAAHGSDHLCCGRLGRADALLTAGLALGRPSWTEAARGCALQVAARARAERRFSLPSSEFECRPYHPGFFRGLAGVGYQLLRLAAPAQLPSVLGWRMPERGGDRE